PRLLRTPLLAVLVASLLLAPAPSPAAAAEPTLGDAITLPDGSVLPEMPAELVRPSVQSEMLAEHAGTPIAAAEGESTMEPLANAGSVAQVVEPLAVTAGATGPAGALPNGLRREVLGFLPYWKRDRTTRAP